MCNGWMQCIGLTYSCAGLLTYLHSWFWSHETDSISETVEDKAKVAIDGPYKVVHGF